MDDILKKSQEQENIFLNKPEGVKRDVFVRAYGSLDMKNVSLITGLRRVGKTTLLRQLYIELLKKGTKSQNIHFFSFDEKSTRNLLFLEGLMEYYLSEHEGNKSKLYIFLDELQYIDFWQGLIKKYVDFYPNVKLVVTGSSSLFIKKKSADSLAGRTYEIFVDKLSFKEYLKIFHNKKINTFSFKEFIAKNKQQKAKSLQEISQEWMKIKPKLMSYYKSYLLYGQFPEVSVFSTLEDKYDYINSSVYSKLIQEDLPEIYDIENQDEFSIIFDIFVKDTGNLLEINNLAREIGISAKTINKYLNILMDAFLLGDHISFTKSIRKKSRAYRKIFIASPNLYAAKNKISPEFKISSILGHFMETDVYWKLKKIFNYNFFYYKNKEEIDFLVTDDPLLKEMIPIEVKYKDQLTSKDLRVVKKYMSQNGGDAYVFAFSAGMYGGVYVLPYPLVEG